MANALPIPLGAVVRLRNWEKYPNPQGKRDPNEGTLTDEWRDYFNSQGTQLQSSTRLPSGPTGFTAQGASVSATALSGPLSGGLYRCTFYASTLIPAGATQSLVVTFLWTENGISKAVSSAAMVGNTVTTTSSLTYTVNVDSGSLISVSTTYSDSGTPGSYDLYVVLETLNG